MTDRHLNLFYSYNQDNELVENNLTRAWIVTMRFISCELRGRLLDGLLAEALRALDSELLVQAPTFEAAQFALQCHIDQAFTLSCSHKYIVAMVSEREGDDGSSTGRGPAECEKTTADHVYNSIPDAWIFDRLGSYCLLIESKVGTNPLADDQIISHAASWLGLSGQELDGHQISLSWDDLANVVRSMLDDIAYGRLAAFEPERLMLVNLREYLTFFGYRAFGGVALDAMPVCPTFVLGHRRGIHLPAFARLNAPPGFRLQCRQERTV